MALSDEKWFARIERPSRYLGNEINSIRKDLSKTEVSVVLAFPDLYEVGMSHLGLKILYQLLNEPSWLAAERVFSPGPDLDDRIRKTEVSLCSLESRLPLSAFDIIGFSLQHELSFTNVLEILDLSKIPFLSSDRPEGFPLVIAGGPACFNPEPVAELFDAIVIGDGEEAGLEICKRVREWKRGKRRKKRDLLMALREIPGLYIPSFFRPNYKPDGTVGTIEPLVPGYVRVKKATLADLNDFPSPVRQIVPYTALVHDRLVLEICRGCTRGCRFCQAGMIYRPVRERRPEEVIRAAEKGLKLTGYEDLSLLSLSSGDYSGLRFVLQELMDRQSETKVAVSLPSLRVDTLDPWWVNEIKRVRKTGFTLAVEAGTDRLRKIINKTISQDDILYMAREVYQAGWNLIKLYFMIGLPEEREEDLQSIIKLAKQIVRFAGKKGKRRRLNVSVSTFVPKAHTPFMWTRQIPLEESRRRLGVIQKGLKGAPIRVKWNEPELSWLEGVFSRGDRKLNRTLIEAWRLGAKFDAWGEHFHLSYWQEAFRRTNIDPAFYLHRERHPGETLPWDHISCGVSKSFLRREWDRALEKKQTPDCRERCLECGACDHQAVDPILAQSTDTEHQRQRPSGAFPHDPIYRYRITFTKLHKAKYLSHLELTRTFIRALRRTGLKLVHSKGYHPMPKVAFAAALPVGVESMQEIMDISVYGALDVQTFHRNLDGQLPQGLQVILIEKLPPNCKGPRLRKSHFLISANGLELRRNDLHRFLASKSFPMVKLTPKGRQEIDARALVKEIRFVRHEELFLVLFHGKGPQIRPDQLVKEVFSLKEDTVPCLRILKIKQVLESC